MYKYKKDQFMEHISPVFSGTLSHTEAYYFYELGHDITKYLEVGSYVGTSAICIGLGMLEQNKECEIHCLDTFMVENKDLAGHGEDSLEAFNKNIKHCGIENMVRVHKGRSEEIHSEVSDSYFDVVFIDGDHTYEGVKRDYENYLSKVKPGGLMLFHDYNMAPGVKQLLDETIDYKLNNFSHTIWGFVIK